MTRRVDREGPVHKGVLNLARLMFPGAYIHHSPNERKDAVEQRKAAELGTVAGHPDIEILWRGRFLSLEVKAPGGNPTGKQTEAGQAIILAGGRWGWVSSVDHAVRIFSDWKQQIAIEDEAVSVPIEEVVS